MLAPLDTKQVDAIEIALAIEMHHKLRSPMMLWGPPGIGKSQLFWQYVARAGIRIIDIRALTRNPVDINGLPFVLFSNGAGNIPSREPTEGDHTGYTVWSRPDLVPSTGEGIVFLDELPNASAAVQAALYQLVQDRCVGPHKLGDGWSVMAAGNRTNDRGGVNQMLSPLSDRLEHYDMAVKLGPWMTWALENDIHPIITGYLRMRDKYDIDDTNINGLPRDSGDDSPYKPAAQPSSGFSFSTPVMPKKLVLNEHCGMLLRFDPAERSFPTPRSWARVSAMLTEIENMKLTGTNFEYATVAGKVGPIAATELLTFARFFRAGFSIEAILRDPDHSPMPDTPAMRCAVAAALARNVNRKSFANAIRYGERALTEEHFVSMVKDATGRNNDLTTTPAYNAFAKKYQDIMN